MEVFAALDSWDYLAIALLLFSLWMLLGGISKVKAANPQQVDAKKLWTRALGGLVAAAAYLACRYFA